MIKNENTIVSSLVSKEQIQTAEIEELVEKKFAGFDSSFFDRIYQKPTAHGR